MILDVPTFFRFVAAGGMLVSLPGLWKGFHCGQTLARFRETIEAGHSLTVHFPTKEVCAAIGNVCPPAQITQEDRYAQCLRHNEEAAKHIFCIGALRK